MWREEDREKLLAEYKMLHDSLTRRSRNAHILYSILLPSSILIVALTIEFSENINNIFSFNASGLLPLFSLTVLIALFLDSYRTEETNRIAWNRIHEIEQNLGIKGERYVYSKIKNT